MPLALELVGAALRGKHKVAEWQVRGGLGFRGGSRVYGGGDGV